MDTGSNPETSCLTFGAEGVTDHGAVAFAIEVIHSGVVETTLATGVWPSPAYPCRLGGSGLRKGSGRILTIALDSV